MYEIYTTPAFILSSVEQGDSDLYVRFYTRDLGFVGAVVTSGRKEISKHRYSAQPYSFVSLSLVKGKRSFRVTGFEHDTHMFMGQSAITQKAIGKITALLLLLIHGEEKDIQLYKLLEILLRATPDYEDTMEIYETYVVVRVLHHLGYFDSSFTDPIPDTLFEETLPTMEDLEHIQKKKHTYIQYINKCIYETQL